MTRYELLDRIGVGGMAEIFRGKAVAAGGFEKPVAIKRILPHLSQDRRFVELLIAEAKVLSLLKHRNIVQIFDVGLGDDGKYFLVMEYVDGKDLRAVQTGLEVRRRRMPFDLALHIGAEVCEALEHAHAAKAPDGKVMSLVHRDVSPSNVLLSRAGEVKLTDFGIAKRAEQEQTGHGAVRGKFAYISPEQARNEHLDPRSDVFSVGVLLWELITNRRLFSGLGDLEALRAVREAKVPRPMEIDSRLSPEIDQILMSSLARDPKSRPTAGQLGQKLRSLRYSLEVTVGDPASELAKIIDTADEVARQSAQMMAAQLPPSSGRSGMFSDHEPSEATVIRIRTADDFATRDSGASIVKARQVIDRFEEEETRQAQLSGDQLKILRSGRRDSAEMEPPTIDAPVKAPRLPGVGPTGPRNRRPTDEPTTARPPLFTDEVMTVAGKKPDLHEHYDSDESTKLVAPRDRRTPPPERIARPATQPPPMPRDVRPPPAPPPDFTAPGTVHERAGVPGLPPRMPTPSSPPMPNTVTLHDESPSITPQPPALPPPPMAPPMATPMMAPPMMAPPPMQSMPAPQPGNYPGWGSPPGMPQAMPPARPTPVPDMFAPPMYPQQRPSQPSIDRRTAPPVAKSLKPWVLIVGALVMAGLAFAITRAFLS